MTNWITKISYKRLLLYSGITTIVLLLIMRIFDSPLHTFEAPNGILSFELAKDLQTSQSIIFSWNEDAKVNAALSLGIDFLFLISYSIFIATTCYLIAQKIRVKSALLFKIGIVLTSMQFLAALFDSIENIALIKILIGSQNKILPLIAYYFASAKFLIIAISLLYIIVGYLFSRTLKQSL